MDQPLIVQAEYSFKGGNNDELCFKKGDLITVTQREEGGWWEGTLNDKTGWFPSNYVNECKAPLPIAEIIRPPEEIQEYRSVVLKDLLDSERAHVAEIQGLLENFLEPLQHTQILSADEYVQLMCNFVEVAKTHDELLTHMEECNDRVGKLFLNKAPLMKQVHQAYCAAHPKAIVILDKHKDDLEKYMERQGAATPGLLVLTTGLSKPFRRLDKYSAMLQELERHMESSHPDRGDTQRSVAVYKDIAATCSATRRQKELELQVLTGPVRGWQGQELSSLGDIIHMGSVAVGVDHRDRYFVLFPQTLLILSVSQRMSAFIYEGKLPLTNIVVHRLEDTDTIKNAFEISGPFIDRIVAVCQGPNEANKWVDLLCSSSPGSMPIGIKRQLSNLSNSSIGGASVGGGASSQQQQQQLQHMSPPANLSMLSQRMNSTIGSIATPPMAVPTATPASATNNSNNVVIGGTAVAAGQTPVPPPHQHQSQHKRSLSFNHHLSYNQYAHQQPNSMPLQPPPLHPMHQPHHPPPQPPQSLPNQTLAAVGAAAPTAAAHQSHKSNSIPTSNSISKPMPASMANARIANTKANWSITSLRPAPPLRPSLLNVTAQIGSGSGGGVGSSGSGGSAGGSASGGGGVGGGVSGGSGGSSNALSTYCSGRKTQPTFEEDALVLRVFEAYCAAYQNNARNTIHSALQPWTPCLPIRGGKLKTSKPFSTSNPQLPFLCNTGGAHYAAAHNTPQQQQQHHHYQQQQQQHQQQTSTSSLNSSYIWREASPNNFNLYSSSVSSLNVGGAAAGYRYSLTGSNATNPGGLDYRALSEERATRKSLNRMKSGFGSGYDNIFMTPLLPRKNKSAVAPKLMKSASSAGTSGAASMFRRSPPQRNRSEDKPPTPTPTSAQFGSMNERYPGGHPGLYDRRLNRSFETSSSSSTSHRYAGYGGGYMLATGGYPIKTTALRRSTPHLAGDDVDGGRYSDDSSGGPAAGCGTRLLGNGNGSGGAGGNSKGCIDASDTHCMANDDGMIGGGMSGGANNRRPLNGVDAQRHSGSWCCGNFVMKQWRKMNNY